MLELISNVYPIFAFFFIGVLLRRFNVASSADGVFLTKLVFFVGFPALILVTIPTLRLDGNSWLIPLCNFLVDLGCILLAVCYVKLKKISGVLAGNLVVGVSLVNTAFVLPFVDAFYGSSGLAIALFLDLGNVVALATIVYGLAFHYSSESMSKTTIARRVLFSPIVIALFIAIAMTVTNASLPTLFEPVLNPIADLALPTLVMAMGIIFSIHQSALAKGHLLVGISVRMLFGGALGLLFSLLFGFRGDTFDVVVLLCAAPVGFVSVTLSSLAKLDVDYAKTFLSLSLIAALILTPLLVFLLQIQ